MGVREQGAGGGVTAGRAQVSGQAIAPAALRALLAACGVSEAAYAGILSTYSAAQQAEVLRLLETARRLAEVAAEEPAAAAAAAAAGVMEELRCALGDVRCFPDHYQHLVDICHHSGLRVGGADPVLALLVGPPSAPAARDWPRSVAPAESGRLGDALREHRTQSSKGLWRVGSDAQERRGDGAPWRRAVRRFARRDAVVAHSQRLQRA